MVKNWLKIVRIYTINNINLDQIDQTANFRPQQVISHNLLQSWRTNVWGSNQLHFAVSSTQQDETEVKAYTECSKRSWDTHLHTWKVAPLWMISWATGSLMYWCNGITMSSTSYALTFLLLFTLSPPLACLWQMKRSLILLQEMYAIDTPYNGYICQLIPNIYIYEVQINLKSTFLSIHIDWSITNS